MSRDSELIRYYSERAAEYERIYRKPERQEDLRTLRSRVSDLMTGHDLLEVACGTGYWTELFSGVARSIVATDAGHEVLEIARRKPYPSGSRVKFVQGNAYDLGGIPGEFSAAFCGFWWSHVPRSRIPGFLEGLHRRVGAGSRVVFVDNIFVDGSSTPVSRYDEEGNGYQARRLSTGAEHEVVKNFWAEDDLRAAVASAGSSIRIENLTYYWCLSYDVGGAR